MLQPLYLTVGPKLIDSLILAPSKYIFVVVIVSKKLHLCLSCPHRNHSPCACVQKNLGGINLEIAPKHFFKIFGSTALPLSLNFSIYQFVECSSLQ